MGFADKVLDGFSQPVIAAGPAGLFVHALLDHAPRALRRKEERVMIQVVSVLHGGRIDFGAHPRSVDQPLAGGDRVPLGCGVDLLGRFAADGALAPRHQDAQIGAAPPGRFLQRAAGDRRHAGTVPVEAQHAPQGLKPPRVGQPPQHLVRAELVDDRHRDRLRQLGHPPKQPRRRFAGMQRQLRQTSLHTRPPPQQHLGTCPSVAWPS